MKRPTKPPKTPSCRQPPTAWPNAAWCSSVIAFYRVV
jgi:hypothetical protein